MKVVNISSKIVFSLFNNSIFANCKKKLHGKVVAFIGVFIASLWLSCNKEQSFEIGTHNPLCIPRAKLLGKFPVRTRKDERFDDEVNGF